MKKSRFQLNSLSAIQLNDPLTVVKLLVNNQHDLWHTSVGRKKVLIHQQAVKRKIKKMLNTANSGCILLSAFLSEPSSGIK
jgi:mRNA deadenylase 3'-5' endonuclease subunit Ccr4